MAEGFRGKQDINTKSFGRIRAIHVDIVRIRPTFDGTVGACRKTPQSGRSACQPPLTGEPRAFQPPLKGELSGDLLFLHKNAK